MHVREMIAIAALGLMVSCRPRASVPLPPPYVPAISPSTSAFPVPPLSIEPQPITPTPPASTLSPTLMARVPDGYELRNDRVRVVISDTTGDVTFWGQPNGRNLLLRRGIVARLTGLPDAEPNGSIEARDQQTWQFYGSDANHVTWRKIYCLDGDNLLASFLYRNDRLAPFTAAIQLVGEIAGVRVHERKLDHFAGSSAFGVLTLTAYNENPAPAIQPTFPVLLQSDTRPCAPADRQSLTTQWRLTAPDEPVP